MKKFLKSQAAVRCLAVILLAAAILALLLPVTARERNGHLIPEPGEIRPFSVISAGASGYDRDSTESEDSDSSGSWGETGGEDKTQGGDKGNADKPEGDGGVSPDENEANVPGASSGENNSGDSNDRPPSDLGPSDTETGTSPTNPNDSSENNSGDTGEPGEEESQLSLGAVLTWYKAGGSERTVVCGPDGTVWGTVLDAQLKNGRFAYELELTGEDSEKASITGISVKEGAETEKKAPASGNINMTLGPGGTGKNYIFTVHAEAERQAADGNRVKEDIAFTFVMKYEKGMDVELSMSWTKADGMRSSLKCGAGEKTVSTVKNTELSDGNFDYALSVEGGDAGAAEIISAGYVSESGESGTMDKSGRIHMSVPPDTDGQTYTVTAYVSVRNTAGGRDELVFTFELRYKKSAELELELIWYRKSTTGQRVICEANGTQSVTVKHNELNNNSFMYHIALGGGAASQGKILSAKITGNNGTKNLTYPQGSVSFAIQNGMASAVYKIQITAELKNDSGGKELVTFEFIVTYKNDVSLEMRYTTIVNGAEAEHIVRCENNRVKTADLIFNDQLEKGVLPFTFEISGDDGSEVVLNKITLYQSGDMKLKTVKNDIGSGRCSGSATMLINGGRVGENNFTITARGADGTDYTFRINVPYMPRGVNEVVINTNIKDGQKVENDTFLDLTVEAYSVDENGGVLSHINAIGSETELKVTLDGETVYYSGTSGHVVQYRLYPKNPETGDYNTHELVIYARDEYGNEKTAVYELQGQRTVDGDVLGKASIYVDMTVLGLGVYGPVEYDVMANEPISYVVAKAIWGEDTGEPYGSAEKTLGWDKSRCSYNGTLDLGFYLRGLGDGSNMGARAKAITAASFESLGGSEEEILAAIDAQLGEGSYYAILWRCIFRNGIIKTAPAAYSIREFDYTRGSGWVYAIGGSFYPGASMCDYTLQPGSTLTLRYTLASGWDIGGGQDGYGNTVGYCISAMNGSFSVHHEYETVTGEDGSKIYRCRCCGTVQECSHEHTQWKDNGDGTCGEFCTDCNKYIYELTEHTWEYSQDESGQSHIKTCTHCGCSENEEHLWIEKSESTATCTEAGTVDIECEICGLKKTVPDPAKGHIYSDRWEVTLTEHYQKCQVCGAEIEGTRGTHTYEDDGAGGWECSVCRSYHDWDCGGSLELISVDCSRKTYVCDRCGLTFIKYGTFEDAHVYENGVCTVCGAKDPDYAESLPEETDEKKKDKSTGSAVR